MYTIIHENPVFSIQLLSAKQAFSLRLYPVMCDDAARQVKDLYWRDEFQKRFIYRKFDP